MIVKFTDDYQIKVSAISTRTYPKGWQGEIDDKMGGMAVKAKKADRIDVTPVESDKPGKGPENESKKQPSA